MGGKRREDRIKEEKERKEKKREKKTNRREWDPLQRNAEAMIGIPTLETSGLVLGLPVPFSGVNLLGKLMEESLEAHSSPNTSCLSYKGKPARWDGGREPQPRASRGQAAQQALVLHGKGHTSWFLSLTPLRICFERPEPFTFRVATF